MINIPKDTNTNTDQSVRDFFDKYYQNRVEYSSNEVDAVLGFFREKGFGEIASSSIATVVLNQSAVDNVKVFKILDTLKGLDEVQLNAFVTEIINVSRIKSSALGYRTGNDANSFEARNIIE